jgi:hypothetical protein
MVGSGVASLLFGMALVVVMPLLGQLGLRPGLWLTPVAGLCWAALCSYFVFFSLERRHAAPRAVGLTLLWALACLAIAFAGALVVVAVADAVAG